MPSDNDILIQVSTEFDKALSDLKNLENNIKQSQAAVNNQLNPAVDNTGTKIAGLGTKVSAAGTKIKNAISGETALAFTALGAGVTAFAKQCVDSAIQSETAWTRFGAMVNSNGGNWKDQKTGVKEWANTVSEETSRSVGSVRNAGMAFLEMGLNVNQMKTATEAAMGVAARAGITETEAADVVRSALLGKGRQLEKLTGLRIDDYKNAEGQIDQERLLNDIYNQNKGAIEEYANSTEGQMNKLQNSLAKLKTGVGQALLPLVSMVAGVVTDIATWFNGLGDAPKQVIAGFVAVVAVVTTLIGTLGLIAGPLINLGTLITKAGKAISKLKISESIGNSWKTFKSKIDSVKTAVGNLKIGDKVKAIKQSVISSWTTLKTKISNVKTAIQEADIAGKLSGVKQSVISSWGTLTTKVGNFKKAIMESSIVTKASAIADTVYAGAKSLLTTVTTAATTAFNALKVALLSNPILLVAMAVIALVAALVYLYNNNEQVRNTLNAIGEYIKGTLINAWNTLQTVLTAVGNAVQGVFEWFGQLGQTLQSVGSQIAGAFSGAVGTISNILSSIGMTILNAILGYLNFAQQFRSQVIMFLTNLFTQLVITIQTRLSQLGAIAGMLVTLLVNTIRTRFNLIVAGVRAIFTNVVNAIRSRLTQAWSTAGALATRIRTVIQQRLQAIVNKVRAIFQSIVSNIRSRLSNAVSAARQKAQEIYQGIKDKITNIPQMVADEFGKIKDRISSALSNAASAAASGAAGIVNAFKSALGIASPGYVQRMTAAEFATLPGHIASSGVRAIDQTSKMARGIVDAWYGNMDNLSVGTSVEDSIIPQFNAFNPLNIDERLITSNITRTGNTPTGGISNNTNNNTYNQDQQEIHNIYIDKISLDCHDLTKQESRELLYNALDGLYTGGV